MKTTPKFPISAPPTREGLYRVETPWCAENQWSYWNGEFFELCTSAAKRSLSGDKSFDLYSRFEPCFWWGLLK